MKAKVILTCGGKGTRVSELTGGVIPKGLCRINKKLNKPLVAYQLEQIQKSGFREIYVSLEADWQVQLFKQSVKVGEFPQLDYTYGLHKWEHPLNTFREPKVFQYIGSSDVYWTYGDLFYLPEVIPEMLEVLRTNNTSVACQMYSKSPRWVKDGKYTNFHKEEKGYIESYSFSDEPSFTIHAPLYLQNRALGILKNELAAEPGHPRTINLLTRLVDSGQLSVVEPSFLLNMNTPSDMERMIGAIAGNNE